MQSGGEKESHEMNRQREGGGRPEGQKAPHLYFQSEKGVFLGKICSAFKSSLLECPESSRKPSYALDQKPP